MNTIVVDVSVAAKGRLPGGDDSLCEEAVDLLRRFSKGELRFIVADLFWPELGNVLWKAVRRGRCSRSAPEIAVFAMQDRNLSTISTAELLQEAFAIATNFGRTFYDFLYVAPAVASKAQLVTADERLANALAAHLHVKWLGSASPS